VGVLVYFGRVTGETLPEDPFRFPFQITMSSLWHAARKNTLPPVHGRLNLEIDTFLFTLEEHAADVYSKLGPEYAHTIISRISIDYSETPRRTLSEHAISVLAKKWKTDQRDEGHARTSGLVLKAFAGRQQFSYTEGFDEIKQQRTESLAIIWLQKKARSRSKRIGSPGRHDFQQIVARA